MSETLNYRHSGNLGDLWYSLGAVKKNCERTNTKANIFLRLGVKAQYINGMEHPIYNEEGNNVMLNIYCFNMAKPLLEAQPYIASVQEYNGEKMDVNLDTFRNNSVNLSAHDIRKWYGYVFPEMMPDISQQVLFVEHPLFNPEYVTPMQTPYIMVNRTQRYLNDKISYRFLRYIGEFIPIIFVGAQEEMLIFQKEVPNMTWFHATDFLHLAWWIREAKLFIGNQSMCYAIAEQMKSHRLLEVCPYIPNVITCGANGEEFITQEGFEYYVKEMIK